MKIRKVEFAPALIPLVFKQQYNRRVAAYARVSTDSVEQETSLEAQRDYYNQYIISHTNWKLVNIYYDSGISGLSRQRRDGFNRMIADALDGKIDLIVTKSISQFARNTVDTLTTIRKLKSAGVEVFFEKENIYTLDSKGEFLITLLSSMAQEESRSISENITWGQRKRFADGRYSVPYSRFLEYDQGGTNMLIVNPEQAKTVRLIYRLFWEGKTERGICEYLNSRQVPTPSAKGSWCKNVIVHILSNEKYKGDARLQKTFTVDFLEKKMKPNEGEVPQYYVEGSHPAIIEPDEWEHVQTEIARRKALGGAYSGKSTLSAKLVCENCSSFYGSKVWHSTDKYRRTIWRCNCKFSNEHRCDTPTVDTQTVQRLFIQAYNQLMKNRKQLIGDCELMRKTLTDSSDLDPQIEQQMEECSIIAEMVKALVKDNAATAQSQDAYLHKYETLTKRYEAASTELDRLQAERTLCAQKDKSIRLFIRTLKKQPEVMDKWSDIIWTVMVEKAIVHKDGSITFIFFNGANVNVK